MNRRDLEAMRRRLADYERREEPELLAWAAGLIFAALIVITQFI